MIDTGATGNFINKDFCSKNKIILIKKDRPETLRMFDGRESDAGKVTHSAEGIMQLGKYTMTVKMDNTKLLDYDAILGLPWVRENKPQFNWEKNTIISINCKTIKATMNEGIPKEYSQYWKVFSEEEATKLPPE